MGRGDKIQGDDPARGTGKASGDMVPDQRDLEGESGHKVIWWRLVPGRDKKKP